MEKIYISACIQCTMRSCARKGHPRNLARHMCGCSVPTTYVSFKKQQCNPMINIDKVVTTASCRIGHGFFAPSARTVDHGPATTTAPWQFVVRNAYVAQRTPTITS